jgi:2-polyprenyl-3-methyl-5-hydroxy-6-metoxy-1,4-benzoquinol methylase
MSSERKSPAAVADHYDAVAGDYHRMYQRENLRTLEAYPANYFRLQILVARLAQSGCKRVYEVGCGEGTPLATMQKMGFDVAGCDISNAMVDRARAVFEKHGIPNDVIQWGDIEDSTTIAPQLRQGRYDAVIAAGVLPHVRNDTLFLDNVKMLLAPKGRVLIEFRNKLFSMFTFNRYTKDFILDDLLAGVGGEVKTVVAAELDRRLATNLPPARSTLSDGKPGYDAILSKFHNPFELVELFEKQGFTKPTIHWYHYHPAPPMLAEALGPAFREEAIRLEHDPSKWRGYFLCSAGVLEAELP